MTLKDHRNHYNVKFLSGYGLSISLKDNKIVLKNGTYPYSDKQEQEESLVVLSQDMQLHFLSFLLLFTCLDLTVSLPNR